MTFNLISNLKAEANPIDKLATVLGYYSLGDGGGGDFYWDAADNTSADNGGTIYVSSKDSNGRWKRLYSGAVNVKWFGAFGNGECNDTGPIQKAINLSEDIYFPKGDYCIFTTITIDGKKLSITSHHEAYINKKFTGGQHGHGFLVTSSVLNVQLNVRNSLPEGVVNFNDNGSQDGIPQFKVEFLAGSFFNLTDSDITFRDSYISEVYAYSFLIATQGKIVFINNQFQDMVVDAVISAYAQNICFVKDNIFENISLLPVEFYVLDTDGNPTSTLPLTPDTTLYAWQFGTAVHLSNNNAFIQNNRFNNIGGLSIALDASTGSGLPQDRIIVSENQFISNSPLLRGANPPGYIWSEHHQSTIVKNNRFTYIQRSTKDGAFKNFRIALTQTNTERPYFEYSGNVFIQPEGVVLPNTSISSVSVNANNTDTIVVVSGNTHNTPDGNFFELFTISSTSPGLTYDISGNNVTCQKFINIINSETFTGTNFFKLPAKLNITNNYVSAATDFILFQGEYGINGGSCNIDISRNIVPLGDITLMNGTTNATIQGNNFGGGTSLKNNYAPTQAGTSFVNIFDNKLGIVLFTVPTSRLITYRMSGNSIFGISQIACGNGSIFERNTWNSSLTLLGSVDNTHISDSVFKSTLTFDSLATTKITNNQFIGGSSGLTNSTAGAPTISGSIIAGNYFYSGSNYIAISLKTTTVYSGLNYIEGNKALNYTSVSNQITNATPSGSLIIVDNYYSDIQTSGTTAKRPMVDTIGYLYFDTTLGKPIYLKSAGPNVWVDSTGTIV